MSHMNHLHVVLLETSLGTWTWQQFTERRSYGFSGPQHTWAMAQPLPTVLGRGQRACGLHHTPGGSVTYLGESLSAHTHTRLAQSATALTVQRASGGRDTGIEAASYSGRNTTLMGRKVPAEGSQAALVCLTRTTGRFQPRVGTVVYVGAYTPMRFMSAVVARLPGGHCWTARETGPQELHCDVGLDGQGGCRPRLMLKPTVFVGRGFQAP